MAENALEQGGGAARTSALKATVASAKRRVVLLSLVLAAASWLAFASNVVAGSGIVGRVSLPWWGLAPAHESARVDRDRGRGVRGRRAEHDLRSSGDPVARIGAETLTAPPRRYPHGQREHESGARGRVAALDERRFGGPARGGGRG